VLEHAGELAALDLTLYEVADVALRKWHDPELARRLTELIIVGTAGHIVSAGDELLRTAIDLAETHGLSVYDAAYRLP
jgi:predicted nucleic acid-binding protein